MRRRNITIAFLHFKSNDTVVQTTVNQFRWLVGWPVHTGIIYSNACALVSLTQLRLYEPEIVHIVRNIVIELCYTEGSVRRDGCIAYIVFDSILLTL